MSQGVIDSESTFIDQDENTNYDVREFSLNGQYQLRSNLRVASQVQYRKVGDLAPSDGLELDYLLLDWIFYSDGAQEVGAQFGRIKNIVGIYNDSRDLPFARPSIILPQSIYSEALRDQYLRLDGGEVYGHHYLVGVGLSWGITAGASDYNEHATYNITGDVIEGSMESNDHIRANLQLNLPMSLDLYGSYSKYSYAIEADLNPVLPNQADVTHWVIGGQWHWNRFEFTSEYAQVHLEMNAPVPNFNGPSIQGILNGDLSQTSQSYYFQGRYQLNSRWAMFARYDLLQLDMHDKYGKKPIENTLDVRSGIYSYSKTRSLGASWQPNDDWLVMLEYHYITGYGWVPPLFEPNVGAQDDKNWSMIAAQVAYRFGW